MNRIQQLVGVTCVRRTETYFAVLVALFSVCIVVANVAAAKVCMLSVFEFDAGVLAYPITFLCIDLINEVFGPKHAKRAVLIGVVLQLVALAIFQGAMNLPCSPYITEFSDHFSEVLGMSGRVVIASMVSFLVAQLLDVKLFTVFRRKFAPKWIRSSGSSIISQIADSTVFTIVAFAGIIPDLWVMFLTSYLVKFATSVLVTPVFYFCTRKGGSR